MNVPKAQPSEAKKAIALGWRLLGANQVEEAEACFSRVLAADPESLAALDGLGVASYRKRKFGDAERHYRKCLSLEPDSAVFKQKLATNLNALGQTEAALVLYREAIAATPDEPILLSNFGNALSGVGQMKEAVEMLRRAHALEPSVLITTNLAKALVKAKQAEEAIVLLTSENTAGQIDFAGPLGDAYMHAGRYGEAVAEFEKARAAGRIDGGQLHNLATALQYLGKMDEAVEVYREAIAKKPDLAASRRQLLSIRTGSESAQEIAGLKDALRQSKLSAADRAEMLIALAKALDDIGEYDEAFANLQAGNQLIRMTLGYDRDRNAEFVDRTIKTFTEDFLSHRRDWGVRTERPIFIVGMPRSGTTLVEQILCSHPAVHGAGELMTVFDIFGGLRKKLKPDLGMPRIAKLLTRESTIEAAQAYLDVIGKLNAEKRFVSDKMPFNFRYLGFISLLFPDAKIIQTIRHPLDIGLSCYFTRFRDALDFSFNMVDVGCYYRDFERLMAHWNGVVRNSVLQVQYEDLIADQEGQSRRLLEFCGLDWDERVIRFHETERPVLTASNWQVRQPIYATSVRRWRNYRDHLKPMIAAMEMGDPEAWRPRF
jgi:tetratricopeptide (TPR) repeat protein